MSPAIQDLKKLPILERIQLVEDLWDTIAEESLLVDLTPEHRAELDQRLDAVEADPAAGTAWEVVRGRILPGK